MSKSNQIELSLPELVGKGYRDFWNFKGRYRVVKGSRASKKSKTMALWTILNLSRYEQANMLVIRQTAATLKDSCFTELKWAISRVGVEREWKITNSPLEMRNIRTKQRIFFRGLDDPLKITSITVEKGVLCWLWIEEAYELTSESAFDTLNESIRGVMPTGYFKQTTLTLNPWNDRHWIKRRFFDTKSDDVLAMTTNYTCNEWLDDADRHEFEAMKARNPKRYRVAGLGEWGTTEGTVFENWEVADLTDTQGSFANVYYGLDFGVDDPNALICIDVEMGQKKIYIFDEWEQSHTSLDVIEREVRKRVGDGVVMCDSAGSQNIIELCRRGIRAVGTRKGGGSINFGIQWLQGFDIIIDYRCENTIREMSNYQWAKDRFGEPLDKPVDKDNHLLDALRYAVEPLHTGGSVKSGRRL